MQPGLRGRPRPSKVICRILCSVLSPRPLGDDLVGGQLGIEAGDLFRQRHLESWAAPDLAVIRLDQTGAQVQQGGFALAVAADEADPFAGFDPEFGVVEEGMDP